MTTDKCPKCGEDRHATDSRFPDLVNYRCGSWVGTQVTFQQSTACRISELESENAKLRAAGDGLAEIVRQVEWLAEVKDGAVVDKCPDCWELEADGHDADCELKAAVAAWHEAKGGA